MTLTRHPAPGPPCSPQSRPPGACSRWAWHGTSWHWIRHAGPLLRESRHLKCDVQLPDQLQIFGLGQPLEIRQRLHGPSNLHDAEAMVGAVLPLRLGLGPPLLGTDLPVPKASHYDYCGAYWLRYMGVERLPTAKQLSYSFSHSFHVLIQLTFRH